MTNVNNHSQHDHSHEHPHTHTHSHQDRNLHGEKDAEVGAGKKVLTIRSHSGLSGDMFLCGLIRTLNLTPQDTDNILNGIFPILKGTVRVEKKKLTILPVGGAGWNFLRNISTEILMMC